MNDLIEQHEPLPDCDCHKCALAERDRLRKDAGRWRKVRAMTEAEVKTMTPLTKRAWERLVRGGWWSKDLEELIDALDEVPNV